MPQRSASNRGADFEKQTISLLLITTYRTEFKANGHRRRLMSCRCRYKSGCGCRLVTCGLLLVLLLCQLLRRALIGISNCFAFTNGVIITWDVIIGVL